jgi:MFS family permease
MSTGNSTLQLNSDPTMRGRVMALWFVAFQGSTPIGGPIVGAVMAFAGPRAGLGLGALTCMIVAALGFVALRRGSADRPSDEFPVDTNGLARRPLPRELRRPSEALTR